MQAKVTIKIKQKSLLIKPKWIKSLVLKVLSSEGSKLNGPVRNTDKTRVSTIVSNGVNFLFVNDKGIREFNLKYLGRDCPTDVIAFDTGDIVISSDAAVRNARTFKTSPVHELYLYVIHGLLHLLGYNDTNKKDRKVMHKREEELCPSIKLKP
ncbi:MAG: rRNA maturation RNase YbeY [Candidatus Omnitrophota bacterium]